MSRIELLKKLLPGFIPLFVFIAADEIWGTKTGLYVAVGSGVLEMIWIATKEKRFDKFILFDTLLLALLGAISIILDNDLFFKLKPGLIELILLAVLALSAFSNMNIIGMMGKRYLKEVTFTEEQLTLMRKSMRRLFYLFLAHTFLVFYSTFFMSKEAWAFISGGLFYLLFGAFFLIEFIRQKRNSSTSTPEEWVPLVDEKGSVLGQAPRSRVHNGSKLLHPVVHMHVLNRNKSLLLQKRPQSKLIQPGKWDTAVGGHIAVGETLQQALQKEAFEEMGLRNFNARLLHVYKWESEVEAELVYLFITHDFEDYHLHSEEVADARFWSKLQVEKQLKGEVFTPNFKYEFRFLKENGLLG